MRRCLHACFFLLALGPALFGCSSTAEQVRALRQRADAGDAEAQVALGQRYLAGEGVEADAVHATSLFRAAAESGSPEGQLALGVAYRNGTGVPQDHEEALRWIYKAAEGGSAKARFVLGMMYEEGDGVPKDLVAAHAWLNLAAATLPPEESALAAQRRDWLADVMTPAQLAEAHRLAREWAQQRR
jgi:TPR repeat protein